VYQARRGSASDLVRAFMLSLWRYISGERMQLTSSAFQSGAKIPTQFTCEGDEISPELSWRDVPSETESLVLTLRDPDAPKAGGFTHWVLYNIPPTVRHIEPNVPRQPVVAGLGLQGKNDAGKIGYVGPCPPSGTHRYFVRLFALNAELRLRPGASHEEVRQAMGGHILDRAELMGTYARKAGRAA
jgi:Raf kinase inhibitor-like YbhB/YbcL family protein